MDYLALKLIHIISSTILFGTGIGSAFYMFCANRQNNLENIYLVTKNVVIADFIFTSSSAIIQLITGILLAHIGGYSFSEQWIIYGIILYIFVGACWLPVVWIQIKMRDLAKVALDTNSQLPKIYFKLYRYWIILGSIAFPTMIAIFYLMVIKP